MSSATLRRLVAGVCVALTVSGCSALDGIRRPPPSPPVAPSSPPKVESFVPIEVLTPEVGVQGGFRLSTVQFTDARRGAALYTDCDTDLCSAVLVTTSDGGRSWTDRPHPRPEAPDQDLALGRDGTIVLTCDLDAWYVSRDDGATFRRSRHRDEPPAELHTLDGPYEMDGLDLVHWADGRPTRVIQPLAGELNAFVHRPGRDLWIAAVQDGRLLTAVSRDEGRTWTAQPVPAPAVAVTSAELLVSGDGGDVWLLGYPGAGDDFQAAWQLGAGGWNPVPADGPTRGRIYAAPLGRSLLAVSGDHVTGILAPDRGYGTVAWPAGAMRVLRDGTLLVTREPGAVFLGTGADLARRWVKIELPGA